MGKTRDLFKKIRETKGIFHAKMGTIKDRNGMDLTEAEDVKRRWQEYTKELYKKDLHDSDNCSSVIIHLEAEIQRIARRDKKAFLSDQCKEIEENNRMGKILDLKKIRDTKGTFHAKMGSIKDRNGMT